MDRMYDVSIDRNRPEPLIEQVARQLQKRIASGMLVAGVRLPSSRLLARRLGISRNTVVQAYERLLADGWVEAGVGRGTFVAEGVAAETTSAARPSAVAWQRLIVQPCPPPIGRELLIRPPDRAGDRSESGPEEPSVAPPAPDASGRPGLIDFAGAVPGADTYPVGPIRDAVASVLATRGEEALGYGPPAGHRPLRAMIAERLAEQGVPATADDVLIVGGSQQGLDLIARLLLRPGDAVVVESPTYGNAMQLWRLHGARVVGVAMDAGGVVPEALAAALARARPKLLYLMPSFQNPTGLSMDAERRRAVLDVARDAGVPVIEDHFDAELHFAGVVPPPLKAIDEAEQVVLVGTFSKILCPGFRLGWVLAPRPLRERLLDVKRIADLTTGLPGQLAVAELCRRGELDRHLERIRVEHATRRDAMLRALRRHMPADTTATEPQGGMTLWLTLPPGVHAVEVHARALRGGVAVAPGSWFFAEDAGAGNLRLSFVGEPIDRIETGVRRLAAVLHELVAERPAHAAWPTHEETTPFV